MKMKNHRSILYASLPPLTAFLLKSSKFKPEKKTIKFDAGLSQKKNCKNHQKIIKFDSSKSIFCDKLQTDSLQ